MRKQSSPKTISIFGATGSIGQSAVDLLKMHKDRFDVRVVTGHSNVEALAQIAIDVQAEIAVIGDETLYDDLKERLTGTDIEMQAGRQALLDAARVSVDLNIMAVVGVAGLEPLFYALEYSKVIAIANKEPLVAAGELLLTKAAEYNVKILPLDSEHNAIYQVFEEANRGSIERLILTASGGPFLNYTKEQMSSATPEQALKHPNWEMGRKISIDSATMMNKALEVIEAHYLFEMPAKQIDVLVHPQSIVHSMVQYCDGSVLAQMGASDMRTPIVYALGWPDRLETSGEKLDLLGASKTSLDFMSPDTTLFPAISLAYDAMEAGQAYCIAMNAANEVAVDAFLKKQIGFLDIIGCTQEAVQRIKYPVVRDLDDIIQFDTLIRNEMLEHIQRTYS